MTSTSSTTGASKMAIDVAKLATVPSRISALQSLSVIVPVYNGSASLSDLVQRLEAVLPPLCSAYELILVNDASLDDSWQVIEGLTLNHGWIRGIDLARNYGQHNALLCGIREARGDIIVTMDDDLQHPPEELPRLLDRLERDTDVVYGTPLREQRGRWRIVASQVSKIVLQRAMGAQAARSISAFRAFRRRGALAFKTYENPFVNVDVVLSWGARSFATVPVRHDPRRTGRSNYYVPDVASSRADDADRLQLATATGRHRDRNLLHGVRIGSAGVRCRTVSIRGQHRCGVPLLGFSHRPLRWRPAILVGGYRRVRGSNSFPFARSTRVSGEGADR